MPTCTKCHAILPQEKFQHDITKKSGYRPSCKMCDSKCKKEFRKKNGDSIRAKQKIMREHRKVSDPDFWKRYHSNHRESILARKKIWREKHQDKKSLWDKNYRVNNLEKILLRRQMKYKLNRETIIQKRRLYYKENHDKLKQQSRKSRLRNRESISAQKAKRYAMTNGSLYAEKFSLDEIYLRDRKICHICKKHVRRRDASMDHIIPVSKSGDHIRANVSLAHKNCNSQRGIGNHIPAQLRLFG